MAIEHSLNDLENNVPGVNFGHALVLVQILIEFSAHRSLHDHYELLAFDESVEELDYVLLLESLQRLCLSVNLLDEMCRAELVADIREFYCYLSLIFPVFTKNHFAKSAYSQGLSNLVVVQNRAIVEVLAYMGSVNSFTYL